MSGSRLFFLHYFLSFVIVCIIPGNMIESVGESVKAYRGSEMIYLLCFLYTYLLGRGALRALYGKKPNQDSTFADSVLTGGMIVIGLAEAAHLGAVVLGQSFSACVRLFLVGVVVFLLAAIVLIGVERYRKKNNKAYAKEAERLRVKKAMTASRPDSKEIILYLVFGAMVLIQILLLVSGQKRYLAGDMTVETVNTMLATDTIYQFNPMTGQPYTAGIPMRLKILCLPTLYAILCNLFDMSAIQVVWNVVPVLALLGSYLAFYTVAKALFPAGNKKRGVFMILVALILWVGTNMYGMDGFGVQYAGFRGVSVRAAILLPYTIGLILRKKWKLVLLCIFAEACIVWTLYGMGACLLVTAGMIAIGIIQKRFLKFGNTDRQGGEDDL